MKKYLLRLSFVCRFRWLFLLPVALVGNAFYLFATPLKYKNQTFIQQKKEEIHRLYQKQCYTKANAQIDLLLPLLESIAERLPFVLCQAYCYFYQKQYLVSANHFYLLAKQYSFSPHVEEALFMRGYSLSCQEVDIRLDQTVTKDAISCLSHYVALYPTGEYRDKADAALQNLEARLMQKAFAAANLYVRLGYYSAAIVALKNFNQTYPDAPLKEKVMKLLKKCYTQEEKNRSKK